jgi:hypothetical protein
MNLVFVYHDVLYFWAPPKHDCTDGSWGAQLRYHVAADILSGLVVRAARDITHRATIIWLEMKFVRQVTNGKGLRSALIDAYTSVSLARPAGVHLPTHSTLPILHIRSRFGNLVNFMENYLYLVVSWFFSCCLFIDVSLCPIVMEWRVLYNAKHYEDGTVTKVSRV